MHSSSSLSWPCLTCLPPLYRTSSLRSYDKIFAEMLAHQEAIQVGSDPGMEPDGGATFLAVAAVAGLAGLAAS